MAKLSISLPDELAEKLAALAKAQGKKLSGLISELITAGLQTVEGDSQNPPLPTTSPPPPQPPSSSSPIPTESGIPKSDEASETKALKDQIEQLERKIEAVETEQRERVQKEETGQYTEGLTKLSEDHYEAQQRLIRVLENPELFGKPHFPHH